MSSALFSRRDFLRTSAALAALGIAGCAAPVQPATGTQGDAAAPAEATYTLEFWGYHSQAGADLINEILDDIEADTGLAAEYINTTGWPEQTQRLNSAIAAATVPDFAHVKDFSMWDYAWRDALTSLDDFYAADGFDASTLRSSVWDAMHYQDKVYGVPYKGSFVWYAWTNDDLLNAAGIDPVADAPENWEDLVEIAKATTDESTGQYGHVFYELGTREVNLMLFSVYAGQAGGSIFNDDLTQLTLDSEACQTALQFMYDLLWTHKVALPPDQMASRWDLVRASVIGSWMMGGWFIGDSRANSPQLNYSVHQWPCNLTCDNADTPEAMIVFKDARNPEASWEVMSQMNRAEVDLRITGLGGSLPAFIENLDTFWQVMEFEEDQERARKTAEIALNSPMRPRLWVEGYEEIVSVVMPEIEAVWFNQKGVAEGLAEANALGNDALARVRAG